MVKKQKQNTTIDKRPSSRNGAKKTSSKPALKKCSGQGQSKNFSHFYLVSELESLNETDGLVDVAADGQVVDSDLADDLVRVDDEETAVGDT